jgi:hypothetical protein
MATGLGDYHRYFIHHLFFLFCIVDVLKQNIIVDSTLLPTISKSNDAFHYLSMNNFDDNDPFDIKLMPIFDRRSRLSRATGKIILYF